MPTATIHPDSFPISYPPFSYAAWIVDQLREQGIRFRSDLPYLLTPETKVEAYIVQPWCMARGMDGVITVWQEKA